MTPADRYEVQLNSWTHVRDAASAAAIRMSRLRLATFLSAAVLIWWGLASLSRSPLALPALGVAAALLVAFAVLVVRHARLLATIERADVGRQLAREGLARIARDWNALPEVPAPADLDDAHPYARDLDLFGHASLTKWLGRSATVEGTRRLSSWLLHPSELEAIAERQTAIEDLAPRRHFRETLAIDGALTTASASDLARFLQWAEGSDLTVPRALQALAIVLPLLIVPLLFGLITGVIDQAWFLLPLVVGVVVSFGYARRMYAVFDRATIGQRVLERYAAMLNQASATTWTAPALERLQKDLAAGGAAPARVAALARLGGWSELRTGAAIFHSLIQAITLWDFHVYFAFERWRRRSGRHVRGWLEALGTIDALAVLARVRADQPTWAWPSVTADAAAMTAVSLGHPLIADAKRVENDVTVGPSGTTFLITGSNMSGKSTLLRAIGLNTVLAHAGAPACAASMTLPAIDLYTSIRVQDSLELGLSYFMAALARLKQIVDAAERGAGPGRRLFYLLDEILQGTNSVERSLAVRAVVRHLLDAGAIGAMTTHDLALAEEEPLRSAARLAHFTEQVHADGTMSFDYRLRPGLATSTNALRLMQLIGIAPK